MNFDGVAGEADNIMKLKSAKSHLDYLERKSEEWYDIVKRGHVGQLRFLKAYYVACREVGFSDEQAWELTKMRVAQMPMDTMFNALSSIMSKKPEEEE